MGASKIQYLNDFAKSQRDDLDSLQLDEDNERDEDGIDTFVLNTSDPTPGNNPNTSCEYLPIPSATRHEYWLIVVLTFWTFVLSVVGFAPLTQEEREGIVGLTVNMNLVVFYGAPLGTIVKVFESKNSVSIHWRTLCK
jgi:solute carrier family 50 protein (sugar transporter)